MDWFCWWWRWPHPNGRWLGVVGYNCSAASQPNPHGPRLCAAQKLSSFALSPMTMEPRTLLIKLIIICIIILYNMTWYQNYDHLQCTIWFQTYIPSSKWAGSGFKSVGGCSWITAKQGEGRGGQTNKSFYPSRAFQPPNTFIANNNKTWKNGDLILPRSFQTFDMAMHAMIPPHRNLLKMVTGCQEQWIVVR